MNHPPTWRLVRQLDDLLTLLSPLQVVGLPTGRQASYEAALGQKIDPAAHLVETSTVFALQPM